jgi:lincosamide nucleotidyltransferase A/C/D/E
MGGWGVDALLGEESRVHHDLDVLVARRHLPRFLAAIASIGFSEAYLWEGENQFVEIDGERFPTAFVQVDGVGREVDVHVIEVSDDGTPTALCEVPWLFDKDSLRGLGQIAGQPVRCVSASTQLQMHSGYQLPAEHRKDAARLRRFLLNQGA